MKKPGGLPALVVMSLSLACADREPVQRPVVLWQSGVVEPRFPTAPEAAWEPVHQRLRREVVPAGDLLVCYSAGGTNDLVSFYAPLYGVEPTSLAWHEVEPEDWLAQRRALAALLGRDLGPTPRGRVHRAELAQRGDLPELVLESPYLDAETGSLVDGTLACLHWRPPGRP